MDSTCTSVRCESEYSSYVMIHSPSDTHKEFEFTISKCNSCSIPGFLFILCTVILLYQVPVILYYTTISPHIDNSDYVDFETCSIKVSD